MGVVEHGKIYDFCITNLVCFAYKPYKSYKSVQRLARLVSKAHQICNAKVHEIPATLHQAFSIGLPGDRQPSLSCGARSKCRFLRAVQSWRPW